MIETTYCANGKLLVQDERNIFFPWRLHLSFYDNVNLLQIDNGAGFVKPVELKTPGDKVTYCAGDYEITIKRTRPNKNSRVISMVEYKRSKQK